MFVVKGMSVANLKCRLQTSRHPEIVPKRWRSLYQDCLEAGPNFYATYLSLPTSV